MKRKKYYIIRKTIKIFKFRCYINIWKYKKNLKVEWGFSNWENKKEV